MCPDVPVRPTVHILGLAVAVLARPGYRTILHRSLPTLHSTAHILLGYTTLLSYTSIPFTTLLSYTTILLTNTAYHNTYLLLYVALHPYTL